MRRLNFEMAMDHTSDRIGRHLRNLKEAQQVFRELDPSQPFLVVDTTLGNQNRLLEEGLAELHRQGLGELAKLFIQKLFGGKIPTSGVDNFKEFLGPDIPLVGHDIREEFSSDVNDQVAAVLFTGSPANISNVLSGSGDQGIKTGGRDLGITHRQVLERGLAIYRLAQEKNLPVAGICYGHQLITYSQGGRVEALDHPRYGQDRVEMAGEYGVDLLVGISGKPLRSGDVAVYHGDMVQPNWEKSGLLLRSSNVEPEIVHGLIHLADSGFTGEVEHDRQLILQLMADKRHLALTLQGHPELTGSEKVLTFSIKQDPTTFEKEPSTELTGDMLDLLNNFFAHYLRQ